MTNDLSVSEMALGLMVFSYFIAAVFSLIGYFLVWRVNCRNRWALYLISAYMVFWFGLGIYSFLSTLNTPGYQVTFLDYCTTIISQLWAVAVFVWAIRGWRRYDQVT